MVSCYFASSFSKLLYEAWKQNGKNIKYDNCLCNDRGGAGEISTLLPFLHLLCPHSSFSIGYSALALGRGTIMQVSMVDWGNRSSPPSNRILTVCENWLDQLLLHNYSKICLSPTFTPNVIKKVCGSVCMYMHVLLLLQPVYTAHGVLLYVFTKHSIIGEFHCVIFFEIHVTNATDESRILCVYKVTNTILFKKTDFWQVLRTLGWRWANNGLCILRWNWIMPEWI
jgi:hypothetical protein